MGFCLANYAQYLVRYGDELSPPSLSVEGDLRHNIACSFRNLTESQDDSVLRIRFCGRLSTSVAYSRSRNVNRQTLGTRYVTVHTPQYLFPLHSFLPSIY
jgi:hypothetical protein